MRKGSTSLGSLGVIPGGICLLILPLLAVLAGTALRPVPVRAAEPSIDEVAGCPLGVRAAIQRRAAWLTSLRWLKRAPERPVRVIHTRATWYGGRFHGRRTASGERFNRHALTLASRHLPMGTRVRVVNMRNGRAALARVNDRGPFGSRRVTADLSQALARRIGLGGHGPVRLEILAKKPRPAS